MAVPLLAWDIYLLLPLCLAGDSSDSGLLLPIILSLVTRLTMYKRIIPQHCSLYSALISMNCLVKFVTQAYYSLFKTFSYN